MRGRSHFAVVMAVTLAACTNFMGPTERADTYVLRQAGTTSFPLSEVEGSIPGSMLADTIRVFRKASISSQSTAYRGTSGSVERVRQDRTIPKSLNGVLLNIDCRINAFCLAIYGPSVGVFRGDSLIFEVNRPNARRVYVR